MRAPGCRTSLALLALLTAVTGFLPGPRAQDYPNRPVRLMTDSAPGSAIDVPVRLIAEGLSRICGQQAVVVNQPGAGGAIAARSADGYRFGVMALSAFVALPGTADNLPVQVLRDAIAVGLPWRRANVYRGSALARDQNAAGFVAGVRFIAGFEWLFFG